VRHAYRKRLPRRLKFLPAFLQANEGAQHARVSAASPQRTQPPAAPARIPNGYATSSPGKG